MSVVAMTIAVEGSPAQERSAASRRTRFIRPALGLIVPVTLALAWEIIVRLGWSSGRLAPPPSVIFCAWIPLFILWLGIFEASKVTLIAVGVFFPVYLGLMGAIQSVDRKLVEVGRAFRLSDFEMVRRILLPRSCRPM